MNRFIGEARLNRLYTAIEQKEEKYDQANKHTAQAILAGFYLLSKTGYLIYRDWKSTLAIDRHRK